MKWTKQPHDEGDGYWYKADWPLGELYADYAPWIDAKRPWLVLWCPLDQGEGLTVATAATHTAAKRAAERYLQKLSKQLRELLP